MTDVVAHSLDPDARDLLLAAFGAPPASELAWRRWRRWLDSENHMDPIAFALLAAMFRNQSRQCLAGRDRMRVKGVMRQTWVSNQHRLLVLREFFARLDRMGVRPLLLPPASIWIRDPWLGLGVRSPIGVALRSPGEAATAIRTAAVIGWWPEGIRLPAWAVDGFTLAARQIRLRGPQDLVIHVEWHGADNQGLLHGRAGDYEPSDPPAVPGARFLKPADELGLLASRPPDAHALSAMATWLVVARGVDRDGVEVHPAISRGGCMEPGWLPLLSTVDALLATDHQTRTGLASPDLAAPVCSRSGTAGRAARVRYHWGRFRAGMGENAGPGHIMAALPGYLMGQWQLHSPKSVIAGIWSAVTRSPDRSEEEGAR